MTQLQKVNNDQLLKCICVYIVKPKRVMGQENDINDESIHNPTTVLLIHPLQRSSYDTAVHLWRTQTMRVAASRLSKETSP